MKEISVDDKLYKELISNIVKMLNEKNDIAVMLSDADLNAYETAMTQRVFGMQLCKIIATEGNLTHSDTIKAVECIFECNSSIVKVKGRKVRKYSPRGWSSYSLIENNIHHKFGKHFSTRFVSSKIMKTLENWGYVESFKTGRSVKMYRINGYKKDFLTTGQVFHS